jgi:hypothetical protein
MVLGGFTGAYSALGDPDRGCRVLKVADSSVLDVAKVSEDRSEVRDGCG